MPRLEVARLTPCFDTDPVPPWVVVFDLTEPVYTIGRSIECDILFSDCHVSKIHATLRRTEEGGYQIIDGAPDGKPSANGVFVGHGDPSVCAKPDKLETNKPHLLRDEACFWMACSDGQYATYFS